MIKVVQVFGLLVLGAVYCLNSHAEEGGRHLPHNHIAVIAGVAYEETADGHNEDGHLAGIAYVRQVSKHWGWGVSFEQEAFGENDQKRHGVLSIPVIYFATERWRLFAGPGIEFREQGDPDKPMFRLGTGYEFPLGGHFTLSPEAAVDFIAGGTNVYVIALSVGYGFP